MEIYFILFIRLIGIFLEHNYALLRPLSFDCAWLVANGYCIEKSTCFYLCSESAKDDRLSMMGIFEMSNNYWLCPVLPDDNVLFAGDHWLLIKCIIPSYHRFVNRSKKLNDFLGVEYEVCCNWRPLSNQNIVQSTWNYSRSWWIVQQTRKICCV